MADTDSTANAAAGGLSLPLYALLPPAVKQILLLVGLAAAIAAGVAMVLWSQGDNYSPLYSGLADRDIGEITAQLESADIPYEFDPGSGLFSVLYVKFPDAWSKSTRDLMDEEFGSTSDWSQVLASYQSKGLIAELALIDELNTVDIIVREAVKQARHVEFDLGFDVEGQTRVVRIASTIRLHQAPAG